jgi:hypothetical protein
MIDLFVDGKIGSVFQFPDVPGDSRPNILLHLRRAAVNNPASHFQPEDAESNPGQVSVIVKQVPARS